jgi:hypothetical protein
MTCPYCRLDTAIGPHGNGFCKKPRAAKSPPAPEGQRRCSRCRESKPADAEHFPRIRSTGLSSWCRVCNRAASVAYARARTEPTKDPLKRLACAFGCAKKGSGQEAGARAELVAAVLAEAQRRSAA